MNNLILTIQNSVKLRLGDGFEVHVNEVLKNNNLKLHGLTICHLKLTLLLNLLAHGYG